MRYSISCTDVGDNDIRNIYNILKVEENAKTYRNYLGTGVFLTRFLMIENVSNAATASFDPAPPLEQIVDTRLIGMTIALEIIGVALS